MDSLLALGVSLTNEIEHTRALRHLRTWLENHDPIVSGLNDDDPGSAVPGGDADRR